MKRAILMLLSALLLVPSGSCGSAGPVFVGIPVETRFAFTNFSLAFYATLGIREHREKPDDYRLVPLLAPGATFRGTFLDFVGTGCPGSVDLQLFLYRRVNAELPIGLDDGEAVEPAPIVAGETLDVPACRVQILETYTIINWEVQEGAALVKIAQDTEIAVELEGHPDFSGIDATWEIIGVDPALADVAPPDASEKVQLTGHVTLADGTGVEGIGVLLRTRFRVRLNDEIEENDPDAGFADPIAFTVTDATGAFSFDRPPGAYQVEFFSDEFKFRPDFVRVESPIQVITTVAEPL